MQLLVVSQHFGLINGAAIDTCELVARWSAQVERVDVVCSRRWFRPDEAPAAANIRAHPLPAFTPGAIRAACRRLVGPETVLFGADDYSLFGKVGRVPYVLRYHGSWPHAVWSGPRYFLKGLWHIPLYVGGFLRADRVVCPSHFSRRWAGRFARRTHVIRNGLRLVSSGCRPPLRRPCLITVAQMDENKGRLLARTIRHLRQEARGVHWHLYLVGAVNYRPLLGLVDNERVFATGPVSNVADYLGEADVFLLASSMENLSVAVTEAMAAGKPVVCFDVGGLGEVVSDEVGALVRRGDVPALARAALRLLEDEEGRQARGRRARDKVKEFDWDRTAPEHLRLFESLLEERRSTADERDWRA